MKRKYVLVATGMTLLLAVSGCASPQSQNSSSSFDLSNLQTITEPGTGDAGTIEWNMPTEPLSIDPLKSYDYAQSTALGNMCESLLHLDPDFSLQPGLAESWEQVDDTTLVFNVRPGVTFWDGTPLTAVDVAHSLNRHLDENEGTWWGKYFRFVESIEQTSDTQVTVNFTAPDALFLSAMSAGPGIITQAAFEEQAGENFGNPSTGVMCTGPFQFTSWSSGNQIALERFDSYWNPDRLPQSSALNLKFISDEKTASNALLSGALDGSYWPQPPAFVKQLRDSGSGELSLGESLTTWDLLSAAKEGPYSDPKVRKALSLAIDRGALAEAVFFGAAEPARTLYSPAQVTYANDVFDAAHEKLGEPVQDLEAAKELLQETGLPTEPMVIAYASENGAHERTATIIQAAAESIGLPAELNAIPAAQYGNIYTDAKTREGVDFFLGTYYGVQDPLDMYTMFESGDIENFVEYSEVDDLIQEARSELDAEKRAELVVQIQDRVLADQVWIPLVHLPATMYQGDRVSGAIASFAYMYSPWATEVGIR